MSFHREKGHGDIHGGLWPVFPSRFGSILKKDIAADHGTVNAVIGSTATP